MGCAAFKKLWKKYENGTLTHDEQELLENHIETCEECEAYLDELLLKNEPIKKKTTTTKSYSPVLENKMETTLANR